MFGPVMSQMRPAASALRRRKIAVIGDERRSVLGQRLLDHGMAPAGDDENAARIDLRPHIAALDRERREACSDVHGRERLRRGLDILRRCDDAGGQALENLELEPQRAVGGARDLCLQRAELGRGEAHLPGERLAVDEGRVARAALVSLSPCWAVTSTK